MAKVSLSENNMRVAMQSLEIGLSYNFELMESPVYHYVQVMTLGDNVIIYDNYLSIYDNYLSI